MAKKYQPMVINISGASGTGKSKLAHVIADACVFAGKTFQIVDEDGLLRGTEGKVDVIVRVNNA